MNRRKRECAQAAYVECALVQALETLLWSEIINVPENDTGVPDDLRELDGSRYLDHYDADDLDTSGVGELTEQLADFVAANWGLLRGIEAAQAGHDFILTRNGHGAG